MMDLPWVNRSIADEYVRVHHRLLWSTFDVQALLHQRYPFGTGAGQEFYDRLWAIAVGGNGSVQYYEVRAVARLVRAMFPRRVHCKVCGKRYRWDSNKWWRDWSVCSRDCRERHVEQFIRRERKRQKDKQCLRQGRQTLREIRSWLRENREASKSPRAASKPQPTSPA